MVSQAIVKHLEGTVVIKSQVLVNSRLKHSTGFVVPMRLPPYSQSARSSPQRSTRRRLMPHDTPPRRGPCTPQSPRIATGETQKRDRHAIRNSRHLHIPTREDKKRSHLMDEVHGGREEHNDPARRLPNAHAADVLPREHDGDHGLPGPRVEHRDGIPAQRRREHVHLVPARARTSPHISSGVQMASAARPFA
jgi:hypothetical protein